MVGWPQEWFLNMSRTQSREFQAIHLIASFEHDCVTQIYELSGQRRPMQHLVTCHLQEAIAKIWSKVICRKPACACQVCTGLPLNIAVPSEAWRDPDAQVSAGVGS